MQIISWLNGRIILLCCTIFLFITVIKFVGAGAFDSPFGDPTEQFVVYFIVYVSLSHARQKTGDIQKKSV